MTSLRNGVTDIDGPASAARDAATRALAALDGRYPVASGSRRAG
jgi:hypothetical protein